MREACAAASAECVAMTTVMPALLHETRHERQNLLARLRVEIARWLVGEEESGLVRESARHRHPLHLPARELVRVGALLFREADVEKTARGARVGLGRGDTLEKERQRDVLERRHRREQIEELKHGGGGLPAVGVALVLGKGREIAPVHEDAARRRAVERPEQVQERRLAAARRTEERGEAAGLEGERDAEERVHPGGPAAAVRFRQGLGDHAGAQNTHPTYDARVGMDAAC